MISDLIRSFKRKRRSARAIAEIMGRKVEAAPHGLDAPLIVSLTSYQARFPTLHLTLRSLLAQTVRPDELVLWLDETDEKALPSEVRGLPGLRIATCPDWRSYKKIVPSLTEQPGAYIVTADDDIYYKRDWLEGLVREAGAGVVSHRAHRVTLTDAGLPRSYEEWQRNLPQPEQSPLIFPTGVGGVLYAPGVFHEDVCNVDLFTRLAPAGDDIWLYWMHRMKGSQPQKIGGSFQVLEWPGSQAHSLRLTNLGGGKSEAVETGNDRALRAMIAHYGWPQA